MPALRIRGLALAAVIAVLALFLAPPGNSAGAAGLTFTVNDTADAVDANPGDHICATAANKCTLRAAVQEANASAGADTIVLSAATYKLTIAGANEDLAATGDLDIAEDVTIQGQGSAKTVIDANQLDRAFETYPVLIVIGQIQFSGLTIRNGLAGVGGAIEANAPRGAGGVVTLDDVSVQGSHATLSGGGIANHGTMIIRNSAISSNKAASGDLGGGIFNTGTLTVTDTRISNNTAAQIGGGIYNLGLTTISGTTFSGNSAGSDGGGVANAGGTMTVTNSTFSDNQAGVSGGGIYNGAAGSNMTLASVTLAGDKSPTGSEISHDNAGPFHLKNTIIAGGGSGTDCSGTLSSDGHNISSDASCSLTKTGDQKNTDPKLGALANNGGPTQTRALLAGSPAIDAGSSDCPPPATDQRQVTRPIGAACDIGAFEASAALTWGDWRCDGAADATDALDALLKAAAAPELSQGTGCPKLGDAVQLQGFGPLTWGDTNCADGITGEDISMILRYLAELAVAPRGGCPEVGKNYALG